MRDTPAFARTLSTSENDVPLPQNWEERQVSNRNICRHLGVFNARGNVRNRGKMLEEKSSLSEKNQSVFF